jgi:glycosyltransferase involved in cell wall biosynthesis
MTKTAKSKLTELSVVFPCYNEEENLPRLMESVLSVIPQYADKYEVIFVNDGSSDKTKEIAESFAGKYPFVRVVTQSNQGFGGALNTGFQSAKYKWVFYTDADLQFDLKEIEKFIPFAKDNDLVIGYRKKRAEGFKRWLFAKGMKIWNFLLLGFPLFIKDIDCAFKLINKKVIDDVGPLSSKGNLVSTEFLFSAYRMGYKMEQLGVNHYKRQFGVSKCGYVKDIVKVIKETFMLRETFVKKAKHRPVLRPGLGFGLRLSH